MNTEPRRFYLSTRDKKIGGVCGGIAEYFNIDSLFIRAIFLFLLLGYGSGLLAYLLLWALAPKDTAL